MSNPSPFPDGAKIAVVSSWDEGTAFDARLAELLEQYGWKGTFFLSPDAIGKDGHLTEKELRAIHAGGHEIGLLYADLAALSGQSEEECIRVLSTLKQALEAASGGSVTSLAFPRGFTASALPDSEALRQAGFDSARIPEEAELLASRLNDWFRLPVTAHALAEHSPLREKWEAIEESGEGIFYLFGRSSEMGEDDEKWADLECNLAYFCGHAHVWYCTQAELYQKLEG